MSDVVFQNMGLTAQYCSWLVAELEELFGDLERLTELVRTKLRSVNA